MTQATKMTCHSEYDVAALHRMWAEGASRQEIARHFGVSKSTVYTWVKRYKLPERMFVATPSDPEPPSPADELLSQDSLALSPWVEARAREVREMHFAERKSEEACNTYSKVSKWRRGICTPGGERHVS